MMVLDTGWDYAWLFTLAAVLGAIGGLTYELLLTVSGRTGAIERPGRLDPRHIDLGVFASMIVGAVAAVAALWIFPPEISTTVTAAGEAVTTTRYSVIDVVGLSLIIGSAGGSFLSAMQARALALVKAEQAETTRRVADEQLKSLKAQVEGGARATELSAAITNAEAAMTATGNSGVGNPPVEAF